MEKTILNPGQHQALIDFMRIYTTQDRFIFQIDGKAGVGKTELTLHIIENLKERFPVENIIVCAPTHKACQVLRDRLAPLLKPPTPVSVTTCHCFLQGQLVYDENGNQKWVFNDKLEPPNLLIIDEVSMVEQSIYDRFQELYNTKGARILTLGDRCQLPPIEETETLFYTHHPVQCSLKKNMRNFRKKYNLFLQQIREYILNPQQIPKFTAYSLAQWLSEYTPTYTLQQMGIDMKSVPDEIWSQYLQEPNVMMLAHRTNKRNNTVQLLNQQIRKYMFQNQSTNKYQIGDRIIFMDYHKSVEQNIFHTNDRATVIDYSIQESLFYEKSFKVYVLTIRTEQISGKTEDNESTIYSIHEDVQKTFDDYDKQIRIALRDNVELLQKCCKEQQCKGFCIHRKQISLSWKEYFENKNNISAPIDYAYCLSIHKSQGSTYDKTYLFLSDFIWFLNNPEPSNLLQFFKLLYVGLSRTRSKTIVF